MVKLDVPIVFLNPCLDGTPSLSNVDHDTFTGNTVYTRCL